MRDELRVMFSECSFTDCLQHFERGVWFGDEYLIFASFGVMSMYIWLNLYIMHNMEILHDIDLPSIYFAVSTHYVDL